MRMRVMVWSTSALALTAVLSLAAQRSADIDPRISTLLGSISEARLREIVAKLQSFETRHTLSGAAPNRGIQVARQWIFDEMSQSSPRLRVTFDTYRIPPQGRRVTRDADLWNVMAVLPGRSPRRIYVSCHYDTIVAAPSASTVDEEDRPPPDPSAPVPPFDAKASDQFAPGRTTTAAGRR